MTASSAMNAPLAARKRGPWKEIVAASIGNALEFYDLLIYGYFAVVIGKLFFPSDNETTSLLLSVASFGISFLMRPLDRAGCAAADRRGTDAPGLLDRGRIRCGHGVHGGTRRAAAARFFRQLAAVDPGPGDRIGGRRQRIVELFADGCAAQRLGMARRFRGRPADRPGGFLHPQPDRRDAGLQKGRRRHAEENTAARCAGQRAPQPAAGHWRGGRRHRLQLRSQALHADLRAEATAHCSDLLVPRRAGDRPDADGDGAGVRHPLRSLRSLQGADRCAANHRFVVLPDVCAAQSLPQCHQPVARASGGGRADRRQPWPDSGDARRHLSHQHSRHRPGPQLQLLGHAVRRLRPADRDVDDRCHRQQARAELLCDRHRADQRARRHLPGPSHAQRRSLLRRPPIIETVDLLLDIHSMHEEAAPIMMSGACKKGLRMAAELGVPEHVIADAGHKNGCRLRDFQEFGDESSAKNALLIETGQHVSAVSTKVALDTAARFLMLTDTVNESDVAEFLQPVKPAPQRFLEVTEPIVAQTMDFRFSENFKGLEQIKHAGTVIAMDGDDPVVTPYDNCVLIQPSVRHLGEGVTVVRLAKAPEPGVCNQAPSGGRLENHFGPALGACIELLVGVRCFTQFQAVGNDLRRRRAAVVDELGQATVISFDVGLAGADLLPFEPEGAEVEGHLALLRQLVLGARILRHEYAHDTDPAGGLGRCHQIVHRQVIGLVAVLVAALITHAFTATVSALAIGEVEDLIDRFLLQRVDRRGAHLRCQLQTIWMIVDNEDLGSAFDHRRMRSHQADRPRAVDRDAFTRQQARQLGRVPAGREDVREHHIIFFPLHRVLGEHQAIEVSVRHAQQLCLATLIGPHVGKTVGCAGTAGVRGQAETGQAFLAVLAKSAADVERQAHAVADLDAVDTGTDFDDFAHVFVAEYTAFFHGGAAFIHVQIGAADVGGGHPNQRVVGNRDGLVWEGAAGYADIVSQTPADPACVLGVGSITKVLVAVLVLQLVEEKRLGLDHTLNPYLSTTVLAGIANADVTTVGQLLSHHSGIASWEEDARWIRDARGERITPGKQWASVEPLNYIRGASPDHDVGTRFHYSNTHYTLLGLLIEAVTAKPFEQVLAERILGPLNMTSTYLERADTQRPSRLCTRYHGGTDAFIEAAGIAPSFRQIQPGWLEISSSNLSRARRHANGSGHFSRRNASRRGDRPWRQCAGLQRDDLVVRGGRLRPRPAHQFGVNACRTSGLVRFATI
nr:hypothetical protein [Tanacetum cinerariifolium]